MTDRVKVLDNSFCIFLYPIRFKERDFENIVTEVEGVICRRKEDQEGPGEHLWKVPKKERFKSEELLPHVARLLNVPEEKDPKDASSRTWELVPSQSVVVQNEWLCTWGNQGRWEWKTKHESEVISLVKIELTLFRIGLGFLSFHISPKSTSLATWQNFLHYFRYLNDRGGVVIASRKTGIEEGVDKWATVVPTALSRPDQTKAEFNFIEIVHALINPFEKYLQASVYIKDQLIPYASLFIEGIPEERERMEVLHRLKNYFHAKQLVDPAPWELANSCEDYQQYTASSWFVLSMEGGSFTVFDPANSRDFWKTEMPNHLRKHYFLVFMLAQMQRLFLMDLSEEVTLYGDSTNPGKHQNLFNDLRKRLLVFTAKAYFHQAMQTEHHHRLYLAWQKKLQIEDLYQEVATEIREIYERTLLELEQKARIDRRNAELQTKQLTQVGTQLNYILLLFGCATLMLCLLQTVGGYLSIDPRKATWKLGISLGVGALLLGTTIGAGLVLLLIRRSKHASAKSIKNHDQSIQDN